MKRLPTRSVAARRSPDASSRSKRLGGGRATNDASSASAKREAGVRRESMRAVRIPAVLTVIVTGPVSVWPSRGAPARASVSGKTTESDNATRETETYADLFIVTPITRAEKIEGERRNIPPRPTPAQSKRARSCDPASAGTPSPTAFTMQMMTGAALSLRLDVARLLLLPTATLPATHSG